MAVDYNNLGEMLLENYVKDFSIQMQQKTVTFDSMFNEARQPLPCIACYGYGAEYTTAVRPDGRYSGECAAECAACMGKKTLPLPIELFYEEDEKGVAHNLLFKKNPPL